MSTLQVIPQTLNNFTQPFKQEFSHNQFNHFQQYLSGLVIGEDKNILEISKFIDRNKTYDNIHHFISNAAWNENEITDKTIEIIKNDKHLKPIITGWLVVDDVIIEKTGKKIDLVGKLFDHSEGRYLNYAHCLVQLSYVDARGVKYPLKAQLYIKEDLLTNKADFKTKHVIAKELLQWAIKKEISNQGVLFDGWYLNEKLVDFIEENQQAWISRLKSNCLIKVAGEYVGAEVLADQLAETDLTEVEIKDKKFRYYSKCFKVKCLKGRKVRLVFVSVYDKKKKTWGKIIILATNQLTWHSEKIIKNYILRWSIETIFRDSKQHLGLGEYQMRKLKGIKRHWCLVFLAYVFLIKVKLTSSLLRKLSHQLKTVGHLCSYYQDQITEMLIHWAYEQFQNKKKPEDLIKTLNLNSPLLAMT